MFFDFTFAALPFLRMELPMEVPMYLVDAGTVTCFVDRWTSSFAADMMVGMCEAAEHGLLTPERVVISTDYFTLEDGHARIDWACQDDVVQLYVLASLLSFGWIRRVTLKGCTASCRVLASATSMLEGLNCVLDYTDYMLT